MSSPIVVACPTCGQHLQVDSKAMGEKVQCDCGTSYPVSPVFLVLPAEDEMPRWLPPTPWAWRLWQQRRAVAIAGAVALFAASAALAAWLMRRPGASAGPMDSASRGSGPVASLPDDDGRPPPADPPDGDPASTAATVPAAPPAQTPPVPAADTAPPAPAPKGDAPEVKDQPPAPPTPAAPPPTPSRPAPAGPPADPPAAVLKADRLWDAFDLDRDEARARYAGKTVDLVVRGRVERDGRGQPYFGARVVWPRAGGSTARLTPRQRQWERDGYPASVRCYLAADQIAAAEALPPDREHVLRGVVEGRMDDPDVYMGYVVVLRDARVVK